MIENTIRRNYLSKYSTIFSCISSLVLLGERISDVNTTLLFYTFVLDCEAYPDIALAAVLLSTRG
jgi:hypothetical protein